MVKAEAPTQIEGKVPPHYKLDWRVLKFLKRIGSGSFGDCFKGTKGGKPVAIKRLRVGLTNKKGFTAFAKEVVILATLDHVNIVNFIGYVLEPCLLIVMDFVAGGTLKAFVAAQEPEAPPSMATMLNILMGSAAGLEYLHATEPMPILHRDIKSENILLTEQLDPRIADLGEARAMAVKGAMTFVGTKGYTAPEVLRGEHYGTPADVFSFAIVMSELVALQSPYADLMTGEDGEEVLTMDQIVAMTSAKEGETLRPTLPSDMDAGLSDLIQMCWAGNADQRPSCSVIVVRLDEIATRFAANQAEVVKEEQDKAARAFCRDLHGLLWTCQTSTFSLAHASTLVTSDATATARDPILSTILSADTGPECIKSLGWLMFGGIEDGSKIIQEPLLEEHIVVHSDNSQALITCTFAVLPSDKTYRWTGADKREFDGLRQALKESENALEAEGSEDLQHAVAAASEEGGAGLKRKRNKLRRRRKKREDSRSKADRDLAAFMKAARFVRGRGAGTIHPSAKLRLFALLMQAQLGDAPADTAQEVEAAGAVELKGSASALQRLKHAAWKLLRGKGRMEAMKEYVELLTELAPHWKVAHILGGHKSSKKEKAKRKYSLLSWGRAEVCVRAKASSSNSLLRTHASFRFLLCLVQIDSDGVGPSSAL